ncbi:hypothetical protein N1030_11070 [Desulfovibrio mangrovi]|uniref:hypothetical protein n=1 Tax=Desulfovibrio mangrovi TaxID=2976983 RepID=UPI0022465720|nr:hypothetical protein [Desulfovibrio mangrovi]UZP66165.1 hypothetical protein N1030_11070 [Desulfovibrio mangrovi]
MILVLPLFMGSQKALWCSDVGRAILAARLEAALRVLGVEQVVAVTDDPEALEGIWPTEDGRIRRIVRDVDSAREVSRFLPLGTRTALEAVQEMTGRPDAPVMVADFRCPFVSGDDMAAALREYEASGRSAMVTVTAVRDNPCQLEGYYTIADAGVVNLFESGGRGEAVLEEAGLLERLSSMWAGRFVTRPFPFDWAAKGVAAEGDGSGNALLYRRSPVTDRTVAYLPYEGNGDDSDDPVCLWLYESEQQARLVVSSEAVLQQETPSRFPTGTELVGACVRKGGDSIPFRLFRLPDGRCCLHAGNHMGNARLHLVPVGDCAVRDGGSGVVEGFMEGGRFFQFDCADWTDRAGRTGGADAFAFWFLNEAGEQGGYDLRLEYPGEGVLWRTEKGSGRKLTMTTGEHISGRQFFPDVYAPLSCIGILPACSYETYDSELAQGTCFGWVLPSERALRIATGFDMLVFRSMSEGDNCG